MRDGVPLLACPRCGLGWWDWSAAASLRPQNFYDRSYFQSDRAARGYDDYDSMEDAARMTARARLRRIAALRGTDRGRSLLEVGCGTGCFLEEARGAGWEVQGIEVSDYAAGRAAERGLPVMRTAIETADLPSGQFDCVALWDVIEHLPDPADALRRLGRATRPGGFLALSTGDVTSLCARLCGPRWHLFTLPEHLFFFSPAALRRMLAAAGFRIRKIAREVNWVPLAYLTERLRKTFGRRPPADAQRPVQTARRPLAIPATLFDVLGIYAVRDANANHLHSHED